MNIAIIGIGAMGSILAATLQQDNDVVMVGRWPEQIDAIKANGLTMIDSSGKRRNTPMPITSDPLSIAGSCDIALLAVKSAHTTQAAYDARIVLTPTGLGVSMQNGLGNLALVQDELGVQRSTVAVTSQGATLLSPGVVRHAGHGLTTIGRLPHLDETSAEWVYLLCETFNRSGWNCTVEDELDALVWGKLAVSAAINPLSAILGVPNGLLLERPEWVTIMSAAAAEVAAVAQAYGIASSRKQMVDNALKVARDTAENTSSMLQDVRRGVPTEIQAITGQVVTVAKRLHVDVPVNEVLLALVEQIDEGSPNPNAIAILEGLAKSINAGRKEAEAAP